MFTKKLTLVRADQVLKFPKSLKTKAKLCPAITVINKMNDLIVKQVLITQFVPFRTCLALLAFLGPNE